MTDQELSGSGKDQAADRSDEPVRRRWLPPVAFALAVGLETLALQHAWTQNRDLFKDAPTILLAALPYLVIGGCMLLARRNWVARPVLLTTLALSTIVGVVTAFSVAPHRRGDLLDGLGVIFGYLLQWFIVVIGVRIAATRSARCALGQDKARSR